MFIELQKQKRELELGFSSFFTSTQQVFYSSQKSAQREF